MRRLNNRPPILQITFLSVVTVFYSGFYLPQMTAQTQDSQLSGQTASERMKEVV
jgi:hypothetical protein